MKTVERTGMRWGWAMASAIALAFAPAASADDGEPPFDFSDAFYRANGIDPGKILGRFNGHDGGSVVDRTTDPDRRDVRITATNGAFDASGQFAYFNLLGAVTPEAFTPDAAGRRARSMADSYRVFVFPKAGTDPLGIADRRQDNLLDTRNGYFSNDPLGIWTLTFVRFTAKAFNTRDGRQALAALASRNGLDLDGTPIVTSASDVDGLAAKGFVQLSTRAKDGSQGFPWVLCPPLKDPRGGAIAPDAVLTVVLLPSGQPLVPAMVAEFLCLQRTGDFCK